MKLNTLLKETKKISIFSIKCKGYETVLKQLYQCTHTPTVSCHGYREGCLSKTREKGICHGFL